MSIKVEYQVIWDCVVEVEADGHAEAAELVRQMGNAEHYDNCNSESVRIFDTNEINEANWD